MIDFIKNEIIHPKSRQKVLKYEPVLSLGFTAWSRVSVGSERVEREGKGRGGLEEDLAEEDRGAPRKCLR